MFRQKATKFLIEQNSDKTGLLICKKSDENSKFGRIIFTKSLKTNFSNVGSNFAVFKDNLYQQEHLIFMRCTWFHFSNVGSNFAAFKDNLYQQENLIFMKSTRFRSHIGFFPSNISQKI